MSLRRPAASRKKRTCRSWFNLSGPIVRRLIRRDEPAHVRGRGSKEAEPRPAEGDLGGRGEGESAVGMPAGGASLEDARDLVAFLAQVMNRIGIVPEQPEVGCAGAHRAEPSHCLVGIGLPGRVGILRDAPHALDAGIGDQPLDHIHVRPLPRQRHGDHADAVFLADREMPVIARHRTEEADRLLVAPRRAAARHALQKREDDAIMHEREARIIADEDLVDRRAERIGKQSSRLRKPLRAAAVIARILAFLGDVVAVAGQGEHSGARGRAARETACRASCRA